MKKPIWKNIICLLLAVIITAASSQPLQTEAASKPWKAAYASILKNWRRIERITGYDSSYLKQYFGKDYKYSHYFLCDVDGNKTPELFLYSSTMRLTTVFTYDGSQVICLGCDNFYKINKAKHTLVVRGHWHGAGGSGVREYSVYQIKGAEMQTKCYFDDMGASFGKNRYTVCHNNNWKKIKKTKASYTSARKKYLRGGKSFSKYKKYPLSSKAGLS